MLIRFEINYGNRVFLVLLTLEYSFHHRLPIQGHDSFFFASGMLSGKVSGRAAGPSGGRQRSDGPGAGTTVARGDGSAADGCGR